MDSKTENTAKRFGLLEKIEKLEKELRNIDRLSAIDFDLDGFYDNIRQVIIVAKYDIPANTEKYFEVRKKFKQDVIGVAKNNGLSRTEDRIEDYGEHFYFVFQCNKEWNLIA